MGGTKGLSDAERFWSKVDKTPTCWLWTRSVGNSGYAVYWIGAEARSVGAHRYAYETLVGPIPEGMQIDHTCHNRVCVNPDHLRPTTPKQNQENRSGPSRGSKSGYRGVSWSSKRRKWRVVVMSNRRYNNVGFFDDVNEANTAAIAARNQLFTHNDADKRVAA